jgi:L-alanine-DL-glutamate epimerase-like enolase superfamily enzyme
MMWDDSLGAGLQMALFDLAARRLDVPLYRLLGQKVRDWCPLSWWSIDMPPEDFAAEAKSALAHGYTSYKLKARPWFDIREQVRAVCAVVPPTFHLDVDFNGLLVDSASAVPVLKELEQFPNVSFFESPIPQMDVAGNKHLRSQTCVPIAMHVGNPPLVTALAEDVCDGFVVSGGLSRVLAESHIIALHNKVFFLQMVGTGITATLALHVAAVSSHARWPAVNCHNLFENMLLRQPLKPVNGLVPVPEAPGLGVEIDWDAIEQFRIEPIAKPYPTKNLLMRLSWPSGAEDYYAHGLQYWFDFMNGRKPVFTPGVKLEVILDDGSATWRKQYEAALKKPAWVMRPN